MNNINENIFRDYDIRGIAHEDLDKKNVYKIGVAIGTILNEKNKKAIVIGYDNRESSVYIFNALTKGLIETGINIVNIGLVTTPMYYFALKYLKINAGIMITGSHNPKKYNGMKISFNGNYNAHGKDIKNIYDVIKKGLFHSGKGSLKKKNIKGEYIDYIKSSINIKPNKLKVVIDPGNGTASIIIKDIFDSLKIDYIAINDISDCNFPNHHPDPSIKKNMQDLKEAVIKYKADVGFAYDGDADRMGMVDSRGNIIEIEEVMIIFIRNIINKYDNKKIVYDVKCSRILKEEIEKLNGIPIEIRTGNPYLRAKITNENIIFGGEFSGHIFFNDKFYGADDGIYVSLRMIEVLINSNKKVIELLKGVKKYYTSDEEDIKINDNIKFEIIEKIKKYCIQKKYNILDIDGCKALFEDGFALVRASNTAPSIRTKFEADSKERLIEIENEFKNIIYELIKNLTD
ncbi:MAG: phosphomannomutase/phosphoglucomutase [Bacilli bacterium]